MSCFVFMHTLPVRLTSIYSKSPASGRCRNWFSVLVSWSLWCCKHRNLFLWIAYHGFQMSWYLRKLVRKHILSAYFQICIECSLKKKQWMCLSEMLCSARCSSSCRFFFFFFLKLFFFYIFFFFTIVFVKIESMFLWLQAFDVVEKSYFETIDDALAEKAHLSNYLLPHNEVHTNTHTHTHTHTHTAKHIDRLSRKLGRGVLCWFP